MLPPFSNPVVAQLFGDGLASGEVAAVPVGDASGVVVAVTIGVGVGVGFSVTSTVTMGVGEGAAGLHAANNTANNSTTVASKKIFFFIDCFSPPSDPYFFQWIAFYDGNVSLKWLKSEAGRVKKF